MVELTTEKFLMILLYGLNIYNTDYYPSDVPEDRVKEEYDFIIVGAGTAGCVLANRLTEVPDWSVVVIEAGGNPNLISKVPFLMKLLQDTDHDWNYTTVPQKRACRATGGICRCPRGHVLGGTSTINGMAYARGNRKDYNDWEASGNVGWSYADVLPYFIKAENATEPYLAASRYHGTKGPQNVQFNTRFVTPLREKYIKAGEEIGLYHRDFNAKEQDNSIDYVQVNIDCSVRDTNARPYLTPIRNRKNLNVIKNSLVVKINIKNKVATGVEYVRDGVRYFIKARKEVIIAAGAINTPQLLMLSGIGPRAELNKHGIKVLSNLPVGENLRDKATVSLYFEFDKNVTITTDIWKTTKSIKEYTQKNRGPLSVNGREAMAFLNPDDKNGPPTISYLFYSFKQEYQRPQYRQVIQLDVITVHPENVGTVKLKSSNPYDYPLIDPKYLTVDKDYELLLKGIRIAFRLMDSSAMKENSPKYFSDDQSKCRGKLGEELVQCLAYWYVAPYYHLVGTAKMGPSNDPKAVVTPKLIVKGFKRLRVVDASVMPKAPRANTNAATTIIAEKAADTIKRRYEFE